MLFLVVPGASVFSAYRRWQKINLCLVVMKVYVKIYIVFATGTRCCRSYSYKDHLPVKTCGKLLRQISSMPRSQSFFIAIILHYKACSLSFTPKKTLLENTSSAIKF
jgi:hypothetical protein